MRIMFNASMPSDLLLCVGSGDLIDNIHRHWKTDYKKLERNHGYIQWWGTADCADILQIRLLEYYCIFLQIKFKILWQI